MAQRNSRLLTVVRDLRPGHVIRVERTNRNGAESWTARVSQVGEHPNGGLYLVYVPCDRPDTIRCGHGVAFFDEGPPRQPYGWQEIEKV